MAFLGHRRSGRVTVLVMGLAVVAVLNYGPVRGLWARAVDRDDSQRVGREELRKY